MHLPPELVLRAVAQAQDQKQQAAPPHDSSQDGPVPRGQATTQPVDPSQPAKSGGGSCMDNSMMLPLLLMLPFLYFFVLRPQQKQEKQRKEVVSKADRGDRIVTSGGIWGVIVNGDKDTVTIRVDADVKIKVDRTAIGRVIRDEPAAKGDAAAQKKT